MLISLNEIKKYVSVPTDVTDQKLLELIGSRLVEIEETIDLAPRYHGIYIAKVVSCEPIPDTHLHLCAIDAGEHNAEFNQLENGLIQVVCGAPNVHAGMLAVWITPGGIVPETYDNENFKLSVRKLRGYESNGMLAGADELGLDTEHKFIAEVDPKIARPGQALAEVFDLNDIILDVENKSLTHRPDCFGLIGFAREVAGILGVHFEEPAVFSGTERMSKAGELPIEVKISDAELCPRYSCAVFELPKHEKSKYLTHDQVFLAKAGMRAIDPMVDLTNILMLETGQPLHAFDYDKLVTVGEAEAPKIVVRAAKDGEELQLLDGKTISCTTDDILITSNDVPVALAGAMGGKNTDIDASTTRVVLESATFSLYHLRKTQMAHGIFSEAITRFTKGQPATMTLSVLVEAVHRLDVGVLANADDYPGKEKQNVVKITTDEINGLLGTGYSVEEIVKTLENVGFKVEVSEITAQGGVHVSVRGANDQAGAGPNHGPLGLDSESATAPRAETSRQDPVRCSVNTAALKVTVPKWRTDIHIKEDIIEEVGRLLGYDNIALSLPTRPFIEATIDPLISLKTELRAILSDNLSMHELLTYSFVSQSLLEKVGMEVDNSYEIVNSISPELQRFRQQIVPSLLDKVRENLKSGHRDFCLYEMNQVSVKSAGLTSEGTPQLKMHLGIVDLGDFYQLKMKLLAMFRELKVSLEYKQLSPETAKHDSYLEPKRSAEIFVQGQKIGAFGEVRAAVLRQFKLDKTVSALELNLEKLSTCTREMKTKFKLSKFPFVERDLTLKVDEEAPFGRFDQVLVGYFDEKKLIAEVTPVSIYQGDDTATKNLSFHLKFSDPEKTLKTEEISAIMEEITIAVSQIGAEVV